MSVKNRFDPDKHMRNYRNRPPPKQMNFYTYSD